MRNVVSQAVESLSAFTDTVHDEVNAPHWSSTADQPVVNDLVADAEKVRSNPGQFVNDEMDEETGEESDESEISNPSADELNPTVSDDDADDSSDDDYDEAAPGTQRTSAGPSRPAPHVKRTPVKPGSNLPEDALEQKQGKSEPEMTMHTVSPDHGAYATSVANVLKSHAARYASRRFSESLPSGNTERPVVDHIGPAEGNEAGHFNSDEVWPSDDPTGEGFTSTHLIYENWDQDGVPGLPDPTDGDSTVLKVSSARIAYSWLPGADNQKNLNYYDPHATAEDITWMRAHSDPDPPPGTVRAVPKPRFDPLWGKR